jgi:succinate dehydrogenase/fumarate reductase flavoprotein subunit
MARPFSFGSSIRDEDSTMGRSVVVAGSGAAGLAAALAAAEAGVEVTVLECHTHVGGSTALSGGVAWIPANHLVPDDSPGEAQRYLYELALGDADHGLIDVFCFEAAAVARRLEELTDIRWQALPYPDYHAERPGGRTQGGRSLEPLPVRPTEATRSKVRTTPNLRGMVTYLELATQQVDRAEIRRRTQEGILTMGPGLIAGLLDALIDRGVTVLTESRARGLILDDRGGVCGVATPSEEIRGRVVLATGGFERNAALARAFLGGPVQAPVGAPWARGDGLRMAMTVGAALGNMSEAWWSPAMRVPGEEIDGQPFYRLILTERARPGTLMVDRNGVRFADEAQNYNDLGRSLFAFDAATFDLPRVPAWMLFDGEYRRTYHLGPLRRDDPDPDWLVTADTLAGLAGSIGVPVDHLEATVERFNRHAAAASDPDFRRGEYAYDLFVGDGSAPHPTLRPLDTPPFFAVEILPGCLGTKGGARTDSDGRVQHADGRGVLRGLYAAGNAAASPFGYGYPGAGGTIGPALVFGMRAGAAAASDNG